MLYVSTFHRYYNLRRRIQMDCITFFITVTGNPVKQKYQDINRVLDENKSPGEDSVKVSGTMCNDI